MGNVTTVESIINDMQKFKPSVLIYSNSCHGQVKLEMVNVTEKVDVRFVARSEGVNDESIFDNLKDALFHIGVPSGNALVRHLEKWQDQ